MKPDQFLILAHGRLHSFPACASLGDLWERLQPANSFSVVVDPSAEPGPVYADQGMCRDPCLCAGKGYCPRDPACNE